MIAAWVGRRRELAAQHAAIQAVEATADDVVEEIRRRRDGLGLDHVYDGTIDALLDLVDALAARREMR